MTPALSPWTPRRPFVSHAVVRPGFITDSPCPNFQIGRIYGPPIALVLHRTDGPTLAGTDAWFANPASQVSAHICVDVVSPLMAHQYVSLPFRAWANGILDPGQRWDDLLREFNHPNLIGVNPNQVTVAIESVGHPGDPVTDVEYEGVREAARWVVAVYPSIVVLTAHRVFEPVQRANCPGPAWLDTGKFQQLAGDIGIAAFS